MFRVVHGTEIRGAARRLLHLSRVRLSGDSVTGGGDRKANLDPTLLSYLVCPLSRKQLRYDESSNQLINDELGIAYPVVDGVPNMIPQDAKLIRKNEDRPKEEELSQQ
ncbi:protein preY, mitochondrial-like [Chiloscyllium plagiosum]|uniref:protein preY, mitochondrial-like n=1 Tax=Chiloscyllium plagiosum TaxID=36176 RepID=UPI001CB87B3F|nr:protein preY, mitochondrial-like [Chiloscyllium plagiosum]